MTTNTDQKVFEQDKTPVLLYCTDSTGASLELDVNSAGQLVLAKLAGEDQTNDIMKVEAQNGSYSAARSTSDVSIGATGAAGDRLRAVLVTVVPTTANLTISDGAGTVVCTVLTTAAVGDRIECYDVIAATSGFVIDSHASGAGTVTAFGRFT